MIMKLWLSILSVAVDRVAPVNNGEQNSNNRNHLILCNAMQGWVCFNTVNCFTNKGCNVENSLCVAGLGVFLERGHLALVAVVVHHLLLIEQLDDGEEDNLEGGNFASMGQHCEVYNE